MNETKLSAIGDEIEQLQIKLEKANTLMDCIFEKYFSRTIDMEGMQISHPDKDNVLRTHELCRNKDTWTRLIWLCHRKLQRLTMSTKQRESVSFLSSVRRS